jgi:uncharacterized protein YggE
MATLAAGVVIASGEVAQAQTASTDPVIVTRGESTIKRAPDRAWLTVATEIRDSRAAEARRRSAEITTAVLNAIKATGLAADAVRTTGYSLSPEMDWTGGTPKLKGYVVRNQVEVRVDDMDKLSDVIDAATVPRGVGLTINGPRFDLKNREAAEQEALAMAVQDAMRRAQALAQGARRTLGPIMRIEDQSEQHVPGPVYRMSETAAMAGQTPTPITPGEIEIRAQVSVTVAIR